MGNADTTAPDNSYFPLETGRYIVYAVQEDQYALTGAPVRQSYQLKEIAGAAYTDVTGQTAYRMLRYRRQNERQPWQPDSVWSARLVNNKAIRTENGQDFVSLLFPLRPGLRWNGNRHNTLGPDTYEVRNTGHPFRVLAKSSAPQ